MPDVGGVQRGEVVRQDGASAAGDGPAAIPGVAAGDEEVRAAVQGRTAVERVNARLKIFWGVDDGNVKGSRRFFARVGVVLAVHAVFATLLASAPRREGTLGKVRLSPIAEALRDRAEVEAEAV